MVYTNKTSPLTSPLTPPLTSPLTSPLTPPGDFFDGWMKNPMSAMISCNDGFRPFSFYIEVIDE